MTDSCENEVCGAARPCDEQVYRSIVREFPTGLVVACLQDNRVVKNWVGAGVAKIYGYSVEEMEQDPMLWFSTVHPSDAPDVRVALNSITADEPHTSEFRIFRKDGQMRWVRETCVAHPHFGGDTLRMLVVVEDITDQMSTTAQLSQCRQILDDSPAAVAIRDSDGRVMYCNQACADIYGFKSPSEAVGTTYDAIVPEDQLDEFKRTVFPRIARTPWSGEVKLKRQDGAVFDAVVSTNVLKDFEGNLVGIYGVVEDITHRKRDEDALRKSEQFLRSVLDAIAAHVAVLDKNGTITAVNEAWNKFARENGDPELKRTGVGVNYLDVCRRAKGAFSEEAKDVLKGLETVLEGRKNSFELEYLCPSPVEPRWFTLRASRLNESGAVVSHIDITERMRAEQNLRESQERYRALVENLDAVIFQLDTDLKPLGLFGHVREISGFGIDELMQAPEMWMETVHPDDVECVAEKYRQIAHERTPSAMEVRLVSRSGAIKWVRTHITPRYDDKGNLVQYDGVGVDVTEQVEARQRQAKYAQKMAALSDLSQKLVASLYFEQILDAATRKIAELLDCLSAVLSIDMTTGAMEHITVYHQDPTVIARAFQAIRQADTDAQSVFGAIQSRPKIIADMRKTSPKLARFGRIARMGPAMFVPIPVAADRTYTLKCARLVGQEPFDDDDLWFLGQVASHLAVALANAILYSRQEKIAETLQRSLIPPEPRISGLDIATGYYPAAGEAAVGGDFFDIIELDDGLVGVVVGDVSGKGVEAAIYTAEAKYMIRGFALQNPSPDHVVKCTNTALSRFIGEDDFVTLIYALIDPAHHTVNYVNAGHEAPLVLCRNMGVVEELRPNGTALGILGGQEFVSATHILESDDLLLLYTDGITDVPRDGDRFGYERLVELVRHAQTDRSADLLQYVMSSIRSFGEDRQPDDQVIVVIRPES